MEFDRVKQLEAEFIELSDEHQDQVGGGGSGVDGTHN